VGPASSDRDNERDKRNPKVKNNPITNYKNMADKKNNTGVDNSGNRNSGNWNSGDGNSFLRELDNRKDME
jgi:hypothetical protein